MIIRNYDSGYVVVRHVSSSSLKDIFICRRADEKNGDEYTVVRVKDIGVCQQLISFFSKEVDDEKFSDFVECFTFQGKLNFVFKHSGETTLTQKLTDENCAFQERLEIAWGIMERIAYLEAPFALMADALAEEHITVSQSLEVRFNYELAYMDRLDDFSIKEIGVMLTDILRQIFDPELSKNTCPEIVEYNEWLIEGDYDTYLDIFYGFNKVYAKLKSKDKAELEKPKTLSFRLWESVKKILKVLRTMLMAALLIGALAYLVYCVVDFVTPASAGSDVQSVDHFDYIGTVDIPDGTVSETETTDGVNSDEIQ